MNEEEVTNKQSINPNPKKNLTIFETVLNADH